MTPLQQYLVNTDDPGLRDQYGRPAFQVVAGPGGQPTQLVGLGQTVAEEVARFQGAVIMLAFAGAAGAAYHGYQRNDSMAWAAVWGALGFVFPVPTIAFAAGQGFARRA